MDKKYGGIKMTVEFKEFKGNKIISLKRSDDDQYPFSFGKQKAKLIVENFEEIKKFAEEESEQEEQKELEAEE